MKSLIHTFFKGILGLFFSFFRHSWLLFIYGWLLSWYNWSMSIYSWLLSRYSWLLSKYSWLWSVYSWLLSRYRWLLSIYIADYCIYLADYLYNNWLLSRYSWWRRYVWYEDTSTSTNNYEKVFSTIINSLKIHNFWTFYRNLNFWYVKLWITDSRFINN